MFRTNQGQTAKQAKKGKQRILENLLEKLPCQTVSIRIIPIFAHIISIY